DRGERCGGVAEGGGAASLRVARSDGDCRVLAPHVLTREQPNPGATEPCSAARTRIAALPPRLALRPSACRGRRELQHGGTRAARRGDPAPEGRAGGVASND